MPISRKVEEQIGRASWIRRMFEEGLALKARVGEANVYDFRDNDVPGSTDRDRGYWRDVGTLDSFYEAHMDLISIHPVFNLYNFHWPVLTGHLPWPPAKFVHGWGERVGRAINSMVSPGAVISGSLVEHSISSG